ncbi:hypothetical protein CK485_13125 [Streptomyces sp. ICBB 8177]|nr:hypothetical protein CK485_13125 [Streptomyces sp. ICBB 8177]
MTRAAQWQRGTCWLYCRRTDALVAWIGPVHVSGGTVPMYACPDCLNALERMAYQRLRAQGPHIHRRAGEQR